MTIDIKQAGKLFLIGGASGVGKSMLVKAIENQGMAVYKRIHSFAPDIAKDRNCELKIVFDMDFFVPETIRRMIAFVKNHQSVVSDLHYAIQPRTDTAFFFGKMIGNNISSAEKYKVAFTPKNLKIFTDNHIVLVLILITCGINQLVRRKAQITERAVKGGADREVARKELLAELKTFRNIVKWLDVNSYIFTNSDKKPDDFHNEVIMFLKSKFRTPP